MVRWLVAGFAALLVLSGACSAVLARTPSPSGAYASLSPGNQKIACAEDESSGSGHAYASGSSHSSSSQAGAGRSGAGSGSGGRGGK